MLSVRHERAQAVRGERAEPLRLRPHGAAGAHRTQDRDQGQQAHHRSAARKEPDSDGSQRPLGPLRETQTDPGHGRHQEEDQDHSIVAEPRVERNHPIRLEAGGQRQAATDRGVGLGPNISKRFHGFPLVRHL